ncbi:MAG: major facilitator superfamily transporter [Chloroflexi bacterium]|nr:major facilitator superfamily transporter [Chloroflexota bacterium]
MNKRSAVRDRLSNLVRSYPRQFWLLFTGMLISTLGASMVWPFLMIYVSGRLKLPLTEVASLMTINATMGLLFSFLAGPVTDRAGRKWVMVVSLAMNALAYLLMSQANTFAAFALLMALSGAFNPLYRVGADAMMADMIPPARRTDAYALMRTSNNLGIAIGPAIGGILASISYSFAFLAGATGLAIYAFLVAFFARETLPPLATKARPPREKFGGYGRIFKDRPFMSFEVVFTLIQICATLIWVLLGVYAKQNYQLPESLFGFIPMTNALMVVFLQLPVTMVTRRFPALRVLAVGSLFYAVGVGSVALGQGFWGFWLSMVVLTFGELILSPTATAYAANLAPANMRGRYMSLFAMTWGVAAGIGPVVGGYLNDNFGPVTIWYGGFLVGLTSVFGFLLMSRRYPEPTIPAVQPGAGDSNQLDI